MQLLLGCSALERHRVDFSVAGYLDLKPLRYSINALRSYAMCAAGVFVVALAVFATRVQAGQHELHARDAFLFVYVHGNTTPVIANGNRAVGMDRHIDVGAVACQKFIDRVVKNLAHAVVEGPLVGAADIHARLFANSLEAL